MLQFVRKARPLAAAVALSVVLAACSDDDDGTGPGGSFSEGDAEAAAQATLDASAALTANEDAFLALTNVLGTISGTVGLAPSHAPLMPFRVGQELGSVRALRASAPAASPAASPILPEEVLGTTYVWSTEENAYVPDQTRTDAPEDGILIVYYATNPVDGTPVLPLSPLGTIELRDRGSATTTLVDLTITQTAGGTTTLADYTVSGTAEETATGYTASFGAEGFVRGDGDRIDFDLDQEELETADSYTAEADYVLTNAADNVTLDLDYGYVETTAGADATTVYTVRNGGDTMVFSVTAAGFEEEMVEEGDVRFNGTTIAVFEGGELLRPDGSQLSDGEMQAIVSVLETSALLFLFSIYILLPFFFILV